MGSAVNFGSTTANLGDRKTDTNEIILETYILFSCLRTNDSKSNALPLSKSYTAIIDLCQAAWLVVRYVRS